MKATTDEMLVRAAVAGDERAFEALVVRHYDRVYRWSARELTRMLGDADAAADVAQDVCAALPARLASFRGESRFATWLYRVVVNAAHDVARRMGRQRRAEQVYAEEEVRARDEAAVHASRVLELRRALETLSDELRLTVYLVHDEGMKHVEAAAVLGVSESTVSWRMHEVRKRLRKLASDERREPA